MPFSLRASVFLVLGLTTAWPALGAKPSVCRDQRYVQGTRIVPGRGGSTDGAFDAIVVENGQVSIASGCAPTHVQ